MKPKTTTRTDLVCLGLGFVAFFCLNAPNSQAQQIQVNAADPAAAAQATVNLDVKVTGKGFKNGAKAKFLVTGTADPGGVQVNSTTFVSATELRVNIDVAETATIAGFDIQVLNSDGRGGKGTELFRVVEKGTNSGMASCPALAAPPASDTRCYDALSGCLDVTFGNNGLVSTDPSVGQVGYNHATAVLIQPDGKIVVSGKTSSGTTGNLSTNNDFVLLRYQTDGSLDITFGDPDPLNPPLRLGFVRTAVTSSGDMSRTSLLQPDGKIVLAGSATGTDGTIWAVARYNTDGTLDPTFGSGGKRTFNVIASSVWDMDIQSDGKLVLVGGPDFVVMRLNQDGSPDASFGTSGKVTTNPSTVKRAAAFAYAVAVQRIPGITGEERIVVGGTAMDMPFAMMRFRPNGTVDSTFGSNGRTYTSFFGFGGLVKSLAIDPTNRIVAAGKAWTANSNCGVYYSDFAVARFTQNGSPDISFSGNGWVTTDWYSGLNGADGLLLQTDGKIVITGGNSYSDTSAQSFALVRYNNDGTPDSSFGISGVGVVTTHTSPGDWSCAIAQQPWDGKLVVAGISSIGKSNVAVARYWP